MLLTKAHYERLVQAGSVETFAAVLSETRYGRLLESGRSDVPGALERAESEDYSLLLRHTQDEWLKEFFRLRVAFTRLQVSIKASLGRREAWSGSPAEFVAPEFVPRVQDAVNAAGEIYGRTGDAMWIDSALERLLQELQMSQTSRSSFLRGLCCLRADLENLRTLVRVKIQPEKEQTDLVSFLLPGGEIPLPAIAGAVSLPWAALVEGFSQAPPLGWGRPGLGEYLERGIRGVLDGHSFARLERLGREAELSYLRQTRYAVFGHEPLVAYYLVSKNEVRNLRQLFAAKLTGAQGDGLKDLVAYVE